MSDPLREAAQAEVAAILFGLVDDETFDRVMAALSAVTVPTPLDVAVRGVVDARRERQAAHKAVNKADLSGIRVREAIDRWDRSGRRLEAALDCLEAAAPQPVPEEPSGA